MSPGGATLPSGWGPEHRPAAVAVTLDNLGEASDLERGLWPVGEPLGRHRSVTRGLPRLLALLSESGLSATFFVEGINAQLYPEALRSIEAAGHEVAYHGWRHEAWRGLSPARERYLLERGADALARIGLRPVGFRPPGGVLRSSAWRTLAAAGFSCCSPAGAGGAQRGALTVPPFRWALIDAFHYVPEFAPRRQTALGDPGLLTPAALHSTLSEALNDTVRQGSFLALVFHPILTDEGAVRRRFEPCWARCVSWSTSGRCGAPRCATSPPGCAINRPPTRGA